MLEVYVTNLSAYVAGFLIGEFLTLPTTEEKITAVIQKVLKDGELACGEKGDEIFLTDYEWTSHEFFPIEEYTNIHDLNEQLQQLEGKSNYELKAISFLLSENIAKDISDAISKADDVIVHENQSIEDVAFNLMQECYSADSLPSIIANHIDYAGIARDLEYDGCYFEIGNDVFEYCG